MNTKNILIFGALAIGGYVVYKKFIAKPTVVAAPIVPITAATASPNVVQSALNSATGNLLTSASNWLSSAMSGENDYVC